MTLVIIRILPEMNILCQGVSNGCRDIINLNENVFDKTSLALSIKSIAFWKLSQLAYYISMTFLDRFSL
jgi:hypothetical protein